MAGVGRFRKAQVLSWWFTELCEGQQEKKLQQQQPRWFPLQAIWQRSPTVSSAESSSGQGPVSPLQEDWALQERLPRLA